jgi:predicted TIM-barrel fold metal-dependent hydrolase
MMERRDFLAGAAASVLAGGAAHALAGSEHDIPIIDTHFHLFDNRRPQGAPYTGSTDYKGGVSLPAMYRANFAKLGVVGAIELEASPWIEDNLWVLEQLQTDPMMVGTVGDLEPEKPEFAEYLDRYRKNKLFLGIRCGNLWGRKPLAELIENPAFIAGIRRLADADLVMDSANPQIDLLRAVVKLNDKVPHLRIVIDHLPSFDPKPEEQASYDAILKEMHGRPDIYAKLSEIEHRGEKARGLAAHKQQLDMFMDVFGEDRVVFGSDWPQSVGAATPAEIVSIARAYFATRSRAAAEKYFWRNSLAVYKWHKRAPNQPSL